MNKLKEALSSFKKKNEMIDVKVTFANGNSLVTGINGDLEGAKKYYMGRTFNLGNGEEDVMTKATKVELV